jgi:hypothetical protein
MTTRGLARLALALSVRPWLWLVALQQLFALAPPGWWRRAPFLPLPAPDYFRFRLVTAYGTAERDPEPADVVTYLHWCREYDRLLPGPTRACNRPARRVVGG